MAEEGTLGLGRAHHARDDDEEPSKEELQRRMALARESITQTVSEIKETVTNQYQSVKETLDWRTHFRKRPVAFSLGALSVGFLVGYGLAGKVRGNGRGREGYPSYDETDVYDRTGARPRSYEEDEEAARHSAFHGHSYAAQPITDGAHESITGGGSTDEAAEEDAARSEVPRGGDYVFSGPQPPAEEGAEQPQRPGLYERFKGTTAYERLQTELASLGDRFMDELSSTAHNVVLPALFNKIKELFGIDLSGRKPQGSGGHGIGTRSAQASASKQEGAGGQAASGQAAGASASLANASRGSSSSSYATSENRGYRSQASEGTSNKGGNDSVLDLDR